MKQFRKPLVTFAKINSAKFLTDSGATEHFTNSRIIFKTFDQGTIRCGNKNSSADLRMEGTGMIEVFKR